MRTSEERKVIAFRAAETKAARRAERVDGAVKTEYPYCRHGIRVHVGTGTDGKPYSEHCARCGTGVAQGVWDETRLPGYSLGNGKRGVRRPNRTTVASTA